MAEKALQGTVPYVIHFDDDNYDWHLDVSADATEEEFQEAIAHCIAQGMDVYDPNECAPDLLEDGTVRYWMSPKEALPI